MNNNLIQHYTHAATEYAYRLLLQACPALLSLVLPYLQQNLKMNTNVNRTYTDQKVTRNTRPAALTIPAPNMIRLNKKSQI